MTYHVDRIRIALSTRLPKELADEIVDAFLQCVGKFNAADFKGCLNEAGIFAEHVLRALTFDITGNAPGEIKRISDTIQTLSKSSNVSESVSVLIPRILSAVAYDLRSKRGAVHVKGVNPQKRDAVLAITSLSWTLAEMLAIYGNISGNELDTIISSLMRRKSPLVEHVGGQPIVTTKLPAYIETLLIIDGHPGGVDRREIGRLVKASSSSITHALTKIKKDRLANCVDGLWFITGTGEESLTKYF